MNHEQRIAELHATYKNGRVEPNIYFVSSKSRFRVKIGQEWHGTFWTITGARNALKQLRIEKLEKQLLRIKNELEELRDEKPN